jgi:hypothetical protein
MTFIGYEIGSKAYKFMRKDNSIFIATHAWFDEEKFPRAKSKSGSSKNKLKICPPDINQDQEDTDSSTDPNTDNDHKEEVVFTPLMKNPRKVVITVMNPTEDHRMIPTIRLKNLNQKYQRYLQDLELVHHCFEDHQGFLNP